MKKTAALLSIFVCLVLNLNISANALTFDPSIAPNLKQQILQDLAFIGGVTSVQSTPLHQKIFGQVNGTVYAKWFQSRVFSVGTNSCGLPNAVACVRPMFANKMWMTKNYTQFSHPQIARVSVIYHEARHTESQHNGWAHATCPTPFLNDSGKDARSIWTGALLQGEPACDITAFGSYGTQTILLKNIAMNCTNCGSKVRADANLYGNDQLGRIVDAASKAAMKKDFAMSSTQF